MRIAVVANTAWYVANFRLSLMRALRARGHEVIAISPEGEDVPRITAEGFEHVSIPLSGRGINPLREWRSVVALRRAFRARRVEMALSYTPKGNIYTSLAWRGLHCRQVANVSGLGSSFIRQNWLTHVVRLLYRMTLPYADWVFFQNEEDRQVCLGAGLVKPELTERIPGSGVDLERFAPAPLPAVGPDRGPVFLLVARLLRDKGIGEFVEAARLARSAVPSARFQLLGSTGADNPTAIAPAKLEQWLREGVVEYLGYTDDVRPSIAAATCVVLPSYREGMPRTLLEAGAMARPLIATDVPGCRDTIDEGRNGYLCKARDAGSLASAMIRMAGLSHEERVAMGLQSREKIQARFNEELVIARYIEITERLGRSPE